MGWIGLHLAISFTREGVARCGSDLDGVPGYGKVRQGCSWSPTAAATSWSRVAAAAGGFMPESGRCTAAGPCLEPPGRGREREEREGVEGSVVNRAGASRDGAT
jgi:hypothetical protein